MTSRCLPAADSITAANLVPCVPQALRLDASVRDSIPYYMLMLDRVRQRAADFDVLHFHIDQFHFPLFRPLAGRTVTTLHGRQDLPDLLALYVGFDDMPLVSISGAQRAPGAESEFCRHRPSWHSRRPAPARHGGRRLSRLPRPHLAGEAARPRHRHCARAGHSAQDRGQGRPRRRGLFPHRDRAAARRPAASNSSARSTTSRRRNSWARRRRCCFRSTGRSRSGLP